jgi:uncharacterized protein
MTTWFMTLAPRPPRTDLHRFARRHPITAFSLGAFGLGWPLLAVTTVTGGWGRTPLGLAYTYVALLGSALVVTWLTGGPGAVRRFLARFLIWRFGVLRWSAVVFALPALTLAVAAVSGTLQTPAGGWLAAAGAYLFQTFVAGALMVNLAEEGAWSGFVQTRLTDRHGLLRGALLTAPLFAAIHLPLQFTPGWTWSSVAISMGLLTVAAPFFRYVLGETLLATRGSLLAVGVQHAAFNASGQLGLPGGWQFLPAVALLAVIVAVVRGVRTRSGRSVAVPPVESRA